jgi:hypothetical protein
VVNPQKHSNHIDHFAFTTIGAQYAERYAAFLRHAYDENEAV